MSRYMSRSIKTFTFDPRHSKEVEKSIEGVGSIEKTRPIDLVWRRTKNGRRERAWSPYDLLSKDALRALSRSS
jgi:hypothetical protein